MSTTVPEAAASPASPARPRAEVLRRADGVELIGEFEGSGFKEPPLLARRGDGQVVQLTELLYAIAEAADGQRDVHAIAAYAGERSGRNVSADNVLYVADRKLRPLGVVALADGSTPELEKRVPLMALRHRRRLLSERVVNFGARAFTWLHLPPVTFLAMIAFLAFDAWLFGVHGIAGGLRSVIYNPELLLAVFASVVVATAFHEFGHASACRYSGARPGEMGVGFYLVWPAFYCDVTDAYRLNRTGRLRTDLGGVYFNAIFAMLAGAVFFRTGQEAALMVAVVMHVIMLQQLLPLLRFDGYYVLSDLTGVPDILERIKPIFRSLVRGRKREPKVAELKPWVRVVVTAYIVTLVPALAFLFAWMVIGFPRVLATVYDSFGLQVDRIVDAAGPAEAGAGVLRTLALVLPVAAMSLSLGRTVRMTGRGLVRWSRGSAPRRVVAAVGAAALVGAAGYIWWPNGDYEPVRPGERGTIGEVLEAIPAAASGRPSFTPEDEARYGSEPTEREAEAARRSGRPAGDERREGVTPQDGSDAPGDGVPGPDGDDDDGGWYLGPEEDWMPSGDGSSGGTDYSSGGTATTQPAPSGTTTEPGTSTTTEPAPGDTGTTTNSEPAPTDGTSTAPTEPAPTSTETTPTAPAPDSSGTSSTTAPRAEDLTTTSPDTTTTTTTP